MTNSPVIVSETFKTDDPDYFKYYEYARVYMVRTKDSSKVYIGITSKSPVCRMFCHEKHYADYLKDPTQEYRAYFDIIKTVDYKYKVVKKFKHGAFKHQLMYFLEQYYNKLISLSNEPVDSICDQNERFHCESCGGKYTKAGKYQHMKTKKHIKLLEN
jgi:hypothetical protein